jgi:hypothetical protein
MLIYPKDWNFSLKIGNSFPLVEKIHLIYLQGISEMLSYYQ